MKIYFQININDLIQLQFLYKIKYNVTDYGIQHLYNIIMTDTIISQEEIKTFMSNQL